MFVYFQSGAAVRNTLEVFVWGVGGVCVEGVGARTTRGLSRLFCWQTPAGARLIRASLGLGILWGRTPVCSGVSHHRTPPPSLPTHSTTKKNLQTHCSLCTVGRTEMTSSPQPHASGVDTRSEILGHVFLMPLHWLEICSQQKYVV